MKSTLMVVILAIGTYGASALAADQLPTLPGTPLKPVWKSTSVAAVENGVYRLAAIPQKEGVNYSSYKFPLSGSLKGKALCFSITTDTPGIPAGLYIRIYNKANVCIGSWKSWSMNFSRTPLQFALVQGKNCGKLEWEADWVKAQDTQVDRMEVIFGQRGQVGKLYQTELRDLKITDIPPEAQKTDTAVSSEGFEDLGIPAKSAELRSSIGFMANGRHYLLTRPQDHGQRGYLLLTDLDAGKTEQYYNPEEIRQRDNFGSILTSKGLFLYDHGGHVIVFDTRTRKTRYLGRPDKSTSHFMVYTEAPDGTIYMGGTYTSTLVAYNPATGKFRNYGRMDPKEKYVDCIATDKNGYVYCGIAFARANIVAMNPKTGKVTQILPEKMRANGKGDVYSGADGYVYVRFGQFRAKMLNGKIVKENVSMPKKEALRPIKSAKYGGKLWKFEDGTQVVSLSLDDQTVTYRDKHGKRKTVPLTYQSNGLHFTSMGTNGRGKIFASTSHPMHFVEYNSNTGKLKDHGPHPAVGGGNFCNIAYGKDGMVYMCQYPSGKLWKFDPARPFLGKKVQANPLPGAITPPDLASTGNAGTGHFTLLDNGNLLLCVGKKDGDKFTFPLQVTAPGKYYLNIAAYEHHLYGTATFELAGKSKKVNLQNVEDRLKVYNMGPVFLKPGTATLTVTCRSNGKSSRVLAGLIGLQLTKDAPAKIALPQDDTPNPQTLAAWKREITRPRAVQAHPDGKHVVISGFPDYGYCGGGIGIYNLATQKQSLIKDWLEGHSCITFRFTDDGDIIGGTDITAPGGGHEVAARPAIFRLNWKTQKVTAHTLIPGVKQVAAVELWNNKVYAVLQNGTLLVADPVTMQIERTFPAGAFGHTSRNSLQKTADNRLFLLQSRGISEIHPQTGDKIPRARMKYNLGSAGANYDGHIYYTSGTRIVRWKIPAPLK